MPEDSNTNNGNIDTTTPPPSFETWLEGQDEATKGMLDGHVKGLKAALDSERDARKNFEKQVRDLAAKADAGSEAQKQLQQMAEQIGTMTRQQEFYDEAHRQGVTNLKLAYRAAAEDGLIDDRGRVNWEQMKNVYPELFGVAGSHPRGDAGTGTQPAPGKVNMNSVIRRAAGYQG